MAGLAPPSSALTVAILVPIAHAIATRASSYAGHGRPGDRTGPAEDYGYARVYGEVLACVLLNGRAFETRYYAVAHRRTLITTYVCLRAVVFHVNAVPLKTPSRSLVNRVTHRATSTLVPAAEQPRRSLIQVQRCSRQMSIKVKCRIHSTRKESHADGHGGCGIAKRCILSPPFARKPPKTFIAS